MRLVLRRVAASAGQDVAPAAQPPVAQVAEDFEGHVLFLVLRVRKGAHGQNDRLLARGASPRRKGG